MRALHSATFSATFGSDQASADAHSGRSAHARALARADAHNASPEYASGASDDVARHYLGRYRLGAPRLGSAYAVPRDAAARPATLTSTAY